MFFSFTLDDAQQPTIKNNITLHDKKQSVNNKKNYKLFLFLKKKNTHKFFFCFLPTDWIENKSNVIYITNKWRFLKKYIYV